jgi:hypothetical protein
MRRTTVVIVVAAAAFGGIALWATRWWLDGIIQPSPASKSQLPIAFIWLVGVTVLMLVALGAYLFHYGRRVCAASLFPPPGAKLVRDTPVLRGAAALRRGIVLQGLGALFVLCGIGLAAAAWRFYAAFSAHAA